MHYLDMGDHVSKCLTLITPDINMTWVIQAQVDRQDIVVYTYVYYASQMQKSKFILINMYWTIKLN